jgi:hypothetical protein
LCPGLEAISVTRYIGDGGIDAQGDLVAGMFPIPIGMQANCLKLQKRLMFGRANFDLFRLHVLRRD